MTDDNNFEEQPIDGDRSIPSVAQNADYSKIGIGAFILFGVCAILYVAIGGINENKPKLMTQAEESTFKTISGNNEPYIEEPISEPSQSALAPTTPAAAPQTSQLELFMQQEALRIAREQQKEMAKRIASPQIIYDDAPAANASAGAQHSNSSGSFGGESDPNLTFAAQYANSGVETVSATQLQNLDTLITQGTMIDGILETAIQSDLPGMVRAIVSQNVYSFNDSTLVIPKGSKLVGRYNSGLVGGQSRVFVIWNRLIRPDGVSANIGSYGADSLGRSGVGGAVDTHFFERFGSSVLLSLIDAAIQIGVNSTDDDDVGTIALDGGNDFSRAAEIALENSIGIKPTVNIHQGTQIKVFVGKDLDFSQVAGNVPR